MIRSLPPSRKKCNQPFFDDGAMQPGVPLETVKVYFYGIVYRIDLGP